MSNADEEPCKHVKYESQNGISGNGFGSEKRTVYPIHLAAFRASRRFLIISNGQRSLYCWI